MSADTSPPHPSAKRKQRKSISYEMVQTAQQMVAQGRKTKEIQQILNLSKNATIKLVKKISEQGDGFLKNFNPSPQRKQTSTIRDQQVKKKIEIYLDADASLTQNGILKKLKQDGIITSQPQISRILKSMNYSRKRFVCVPENRNTETVLDNKHIYCQMISSVPNESIIFLDTVQRMLEDFNPGMSAYFHETKRRIEQGISRNVL